MSETWAEHFRLVAKDWVAKDAAASILEETKSAVLAQMMISQGDMPVSRAEMQVKASPEWKDHILQMVQAREAANLAKVKLEYMRMKFSEWQSREATARAERRVA
jgi:hypothetical protein